MGSQDCCFVDVGVVVPELSPVVSARVAAVPRSLPAIAEVFSSAVFDGGGGVDAAPLANDPPGHGWCVCPNGCWGCRCMSGTLG